MMEAFLAARSDIAGDLYGDVRPVCCGRVVTDLLPAPDRPFARECPDVLAELLTVDYR